jgi:hypothetical protein
MGSLQFDTAPLSTDQTPEQAATYPHSLAICSESLYAMLGKLWGSSRWLLYKSDTPPLSAELDVRTPRSEKPLSKPNSVSRYILLDQGTLHYLKRKSFAPEADSKERDRVQHRSKGYYFLNGLLRNSRVAVGLLRMSLNYGCG